VIIQMEAGGEALALGTLKRRAGGQFDPAVVSAFEAVAAEGRLAARAKVERGEPG